MNIFKAHEFITLETIHDIETAWTVFSTLESVNSVRRILQARYDSSFDENDFNIKQIVDCFNIGHKYFVEARKASLVVKPLLVFYGMRNIAAGVILFRKRGSSLENLKGYHGLKLNRCEEKPFGEQSLTVKSEGIFTEFNDYTRRYDILNKNSYVGIKADDSSELEGNEFTILELLSRIPEIKYELHLNLNVPPRALIGTTETVKEGTKNFHKYTFYCHRQMNEDKSLIDSLFPKIIPYFKDEKNVGALHNIITYKVPSNPDGRGTLWLPSFFSINRQTYFISYINDLHLSEPTIHYMTAFILSNIVRYYPELWENTFTRRDDNGYIPVLEKFYRVIDRKFPIIIANELLNKKFIL